MSRVWHQVQFSTIVVETWTQFGACAGTVSMMQRVTDHLVAQKSTTPKLRTIPSIGITNAISEPSALSLQ